MGHPYEQPDGPFMGADYYYVDAPLYERPRLVAATPQGWDSRSGWRFILNPGGERAIGASHWDRLYPVEYRAAALRALADYRRQAQEEAVWLILRRLDTLDALVRQLDVLTRRVDELATHLGVDP